VGDEGTARDVANESVDAHPCGSPLLDVSSFHALRMEKSENFKNSVNAIT
jgi:hypothetical protein